VRKRSNDRELTPKDLEELAEALRSARHRLPLTDDEIAALAGRARIREVLYGDVVIREGEEPKEFYFIMTGQLRSADLRGEEPRLLNYHAAKTFIGERALLIGERRSATVDAISDTKLAFWDKATIEWLLGLNRQVRPFFDELYYRRQIRSQAPFPASNGMKWWSSTTASAP